MSTAVGIQNQVLFQFASSIKQDIEKELSDEEALLLFQQYSTINNEEYVVVYENHIYLGDQEESLIGFLTSEELPQLEDLQFNFGQKKQQTRIVSKNNSTLMSKAQFENIDIKQSQIDEDDEININQSNRRIEEYFKPNGYKFKTYLYYEGMVEQQSVNKIEQVQNTPQMMQYQNDEDQEVIKYMHKILRQSSKKIHIIKQQIMYQINGMFDSFDEQFVEGFRREIRLLEQLQKKDDLHLILQKVKDQLQVKFEKLENLASIISEFKISPNVHFVDPLMNLPAAEDKKKLDRFFRYDSPPKKKISKWRKVNDRKELYRCPQCKEEFKIRIHFRQHLSVIHNIVLKYMCPFCEYYSGCNIKLSVHLIESHGSVDLEKNVPKYQCKFTNLEFTNKLYLAFHIRDNINYQNYE